MPAGQFLQTLTVNANGVVEAKGPLDHVTDEVVEMCVWVYQRTANGSDAIANNMKDGPGLMRKMNVAKQKTKLEISKPRGKAGGKPQWSLDLDDRMNAKAEFTDGSATAIAIGVFLDQNKNERIFLWSEPVELKVESETPQPASAKRSTAKRSTAKRSTAKRSSTKRTSAKRGSS